MGSKFKTYLQEMKYKLKALHPMEQNQINLLPKKKVKSKATKTTSHGNISAQYCTPD